MCTPHNISNTKGLLGEGKGEGGRPSLDMKREGHSERPGNRRNKTESAVCSDWKCDAPGSWWRSWQLVALLAAGKSRGRNCPFQLKSMYIRGLSLCQCFSICGSQLLWGSHIKCLYYDLDYSYEVATGIMLWLGRVTNSRDDSKELQPSES